MQAVKLGAIPVHPESQAFVEQNLSFAFDLVLQQRVRSERVSLAPVVTLLSTPAGLSNALQLRRHGFDTVGVLVGDVRPFA